MKIEGVPEGWELVRIGVPNIGEYVLGRTGVIILMNNESTARTVLPILKKAEPLCTWPLGVFADGWVAEGHEGAVYWYRTKPSWNSEKNYWDYTTTTVRSCDHLANGPVFRSDLRRDERIQKVGPTIEATLKGGGA